MASKTGSFDFSKISEKMEPIGVIYNEYDDTQKHPFKGSFDGKGQRITNLHITGTNNVGLFGTVGSKTVIKNIYIDERCTFEGTGEHVGLIGQFYGKNSEVSILSNIVTFANISSKQHSGGLIGHQKDGSGIIKISNCLIGGTIKASDSNAAFIGTMLGTSNNGANSNGCDIHNCLGIATIETEWSNQIFASKKDLNQNYVNSYAHLLEGKLNYFEDLKNNDINKNLNLLSKDDVGYFFEKEGKKIYVNSPEFANLLGVEWIYDIDKYGAFPVPFAKISNNDNISVTDKVIVTYPTPEIDSATSYENLDEVENLEEISAIIGNNTNPDKTKRFVSGLTATFFYPRSTKPESGGILEDLPEDPAGTNNNPDFLIACDLSNIFSTDEDKNVLSRDRKIYEPQILIRHIFRIKNGKEFAEQFSGSVDKNREYVKENRRIITSPEGMKFQVRLESPVAIAKDEFSFAPPSKIYYKISDTDYRRVRGGDMEILKWDDSQQKFLPTNDNPFSVQKDGDVDPYVFNGLGSRKYEGETEYNICGAQGLYKRMLVALDASKNHGRYLVRLYGLDIYNNRIKICNSSEDLIVQEYDIEFLTENKGYNLLLEGTSNETVKNKEITLKKAYGAPNVVIDFDEYAALLKEDNTSGLGVMDLDDYFVTSKKNSKGHYFKWPFRWDQSSYGFGYAQDEQVHQYAYNYNIYVIADNCDATPYALGHSNIKDVTHLTTNGNESGFFYYMNSSSDPGVACRLNLWELCQGSVIHVVAHLNEFSGETKANMCFNFVAVARNKERYKIHSFISNEVSDAGNWHQVYYQFMPDFEKIQYAQKKLGNIDHFELELDNNCHNSEYADYAVDNISMWVVRPQVYAEMLEPLCDEASSLNVKVQLPFEPLLASLGLNETVDPAATGGAENGNGTEVQSRSPYWSELNQTRAAEDEFTVYYCFLDKAKFNRLLRTKGYETAFKESVLTYNYAGTTGSTSYGIIHFYPKFSENLEIKGDGRFTIENINNGFIKVGDVYQEIDENGIRYLSLLTRPSKGEENSFVAGEEYIIGLYVDEDNTLGDKAPGYMEFDIANRCSHTGEFKVESANVIEITNDNGNVDLPDTEFCLGSSPTIKITLKNLAHKIEGTDEYENFDGKLDWYAGSLADFNKELKYINEEKGEYVTLQESLSHLREITSDEIKDVAALDIIELKNGFTQPMKDLIKSLMEKENPFGLKMLTLGVSEFKYVQISATATDSLNSLVAIPIIPSKYLGENGKPAEVNGKQYKVCPSPMEIRLKVSSNAPGMFHGLPLDYPEDLVDVPVRIGLGQIAKTEKDGSLRIPIIEVSAPSKEANGIKLRKAEVGDNLTDQEVRLIQTDDPRYSNLSLMATSGAEETIAEGVSDEVNSDSGYAYPIVGTIQKLVAKEAARNSADNKDNAFYVNFDKGFDFREGYTYVMKFDIEEDGPTGFNNTACPGQHVFTIKVVPEYLVWNGQGAGAGNINWNNDENWSRVTTADIFPEKNSDEISHDNTKTDFGTDENKDLLKRFVTDGAEIDKPTEDVKEKDYNTSEGAFAPMEFTKVIVGSGSKFPQLYHVEDVNLGTTGMKWSKISELVQAEGSVTTSGSMIDKYLEKYNSEHDNKGFPSRYIQYDMMATTKGSAPESTVSVWVKPWYANTAEQVHFRPNSEMGGQQHMRYEKAWVEMELKPDYWYSVSSPLQSVYAGDMYLPTVGARQVTPLFTDINFNNKDLTINNRFKPAVYQRSWNLASDMVYEVDGNSRDVFRRINWSHVYNDVKVGYKAGEGFSIKTDISEANFTGATAKDANGKATPVDGKVLFRLPKADTDYTYYTYDDETGKHGPDDVTKAKNAHHRLNDVSKEFSQKIKANGNSSFFLVGNPFMAHIDMKKFLDVNKDVIDNKYWIINGEHQSVTIVEQDEIVGSDGTITQVGFHTPGQNEVALLPPMAGFMVKAITSSSDLTVNFTPEMMVVTEPIAVDATKKEPWLAKRKAMGTRSGDYLPDMIRISAVIDGERESASLLRFGSGYSEGIDSHDAETVIDPENGTRATVYTTCGGEALSINSTGDAEATEIGVYADDAREITLLFEGEGCSHGYSLFDRESGESKPLYDGMTVVIRGASAGRYLLTRGGYADETLSEGLRIEGHAGEIRAINGAGGESVTLRVYTPNGIEVGSVSGRGEASLSVEPGVYVAVAVSGGQNCRVKLRI